MFKNSRIAFIFLSINGLLGADVSAATTMISSENVGHHIYQAACRNCHAPGLSTDIGAPTAFDQKAWKKQLKAARKEAKQDPQKFKDEYSYLAYRVEHGRGLMQHGGLCLESKLSP
jgi:hypothetical protein